MMPGIQAERFVVEAFPMATLLRVCLTGTCVQGSAVSIFFIIRYLAMRKHGSLSTIVSRKYVAIRIPVQKSS